MKHKQPFIWIIVLVTLALTLAACGGDNTTSPQAESAPTEVVPAGDPANGEISYNQVCVACHGLEGVGVENLGKPFTTSEFIRGQSDAELLAFIKQGRPTSDPANTTGIDMPPKGGNPALTDEQILDVIAYIRTLQP